MTYCSNCGYKNKQEANFCTSCGTKLNTSPPTRQQSKPSRYKKWITWLVVLCLLLGASAFVYIKQDGQVLGLGAPMKSKSHTFEKEFQAKDKTEIVFSEETPETSEIPKLEFMDEEQWKTCIESDVYSEEECLAADKEFAKEGEAGSDFQNYTNDRFGFQLEYPSDFSEGAPPENNDGMEAHDGNASFVVYGSHMTTGGEAVSALESINSIYQEDMQTIEASNPVSYHKAEDNWYVISYVEDGNIVYKKSLLGDDFIVDLLIEYPENEQESYESVVNRMIESFDVL